MRYLIALLASLTFFAGHVLADPPASQPATATLLGGKIAFAAPDGWKRQAIQRPGDAIAIYIAPDHDGFFDIQALPDNAAITPQAARLMVTQLRNGHKKAGQQILEGPEILKDAQVAISIHERYKTKDGKTADEKHLFRQVGARAVEVDVQSLSEDPEHIAAVDQKAEETLLSARWVRIAPRRKG
ncbi:MAG TPA: hypothetical protein VFC78_03680 [Tepidisphaeraceae bacterium]|nr:hypothetical protein [Tepidisphaeraceae bacterium]